MKIALSLCLAFLALAPARAQIFRPAAVNGAVVGGIAGAIIGHNSGSLHHNGWQGAAIGAGAGLLLGAAIDNSRYDAGWQGGYVYRETPRYYSAYRSGGYGYASYGYGRPDYVGSGVFLGGVAGAIVGHNSRAFHHNAWNGALWGAGLGYLFGAVADSYSYAPYPYRAVVERPVIYAQPPTASASAAAPQNVTIINNYYSAPATPMSSANGLFGRN